MVCNIVKADTLGDFCDEYFLEADTNCTALARQIGVSEGTIRHWRNSGRSMTVNDLLAGIRRWPTALRLRLGGAIIGDKYVSVPVEGDVQHVTARGLRLAVLKFNVAVSSLLLEISEALEDGIITRSEAQAILADLRPVAGSLTHITACVVAAAGKTLLVHAVHPRRV